MRIVVVCLVSVLVLACASCSKPGNQEPVYPVVGKATYNGSPASGAVVFFRRKTDGANKAPTIVGIVQEDGSFEMVSGPLGQGVPAGDYDVLIEWKRVTGHGKRRPQAGPDLLQGRFADPNHPLFHAKVEPSPNKLPPFELANPTGG